MPDFVSIFLSEIVLFRGDIYILMVEKDISLKFHLLVVILFSWWHFTVIAENSGPFFYITEQVTFIRLQLSVCWLSFSFCTTHPGSKVFNLRH